MPVDPEREIFTRRQILVAGAAGIGGVLAATLGVPAAIAPAEPLKPIAAEKQPSPVVINPSFEDGINTPTGWRTMSPRGLVSVQTWESGIARTGNRCVSITGPTPIRYSIIWETTDLISVQPSQPYTLSVWARSEGSFDSNTGWGSAMMWYYDAAGNYLIGRGVSLSRPDPIVTWQLYTRSTTIPQNAAGVQLALIYSSSSVADRNKVYFDDVSLAGPLRYKDYLPRISNNAPK